MLQRSVEVLLGVIALGHFNIAAGKEHTWICPNNWEYYSDQSHFNCLLPLDESQTAKSSASRKCQGYNATLVSILTAEKTDYIKNLMVSKSWDSIWLSLVKGGWTTVEGQLPVAYRPKGFYMSGYRSQNYYHAARECVEMTNDDTVSWSWSQCNGGKNPPSRNIICEKSPAAECLAGWYGRRCEKECHCYGLSCGLRIEDQTCPFGCQHGWSGTSCDKKSEKASLRYNCVNSDRGARYVSILVDTKGTVYGSMYALDDNKSSTPWCSDTSLTTQKSLNLVTIVIKLTHDGLDELQRGKCAGKELEEDVFEWRFAMKERAGVVMPLDQELVVTCNFSDAESLSRSGDVEVVGKVDLDTSNYSENKVGVVLELVDAATKKSLTSSSVGTPVALQVRYGLHKDPLVKSVYPYNCVASTPSHSSSLSLLNSHGCQMPASPVKPFQRTNETNTLRTPYFYFFALRRSSHVVFRCSFIFCYDMSCAVGCRTPTHWLPNSRHIRSATKAFTGHRTMQVAVTLG